MVKTNGTIGDVPDLYAGVKQLALTQAAQIHIEKCVPIFISRQRYWKTMTELWNQIATEADEIINTPNLDHGSREAIMAFRPGVFMRALSKGPDPLGRTSAITWAWSKGLDTPEAAPLVDRAETLAKQ